MVKSLQEEGSILFDMKIDQIHTQERQQEQDQSHGLSR